MLLQPPLSFPFFLKNLNSVLQPVLQQDLH